MFKLQEYNLQHPDPIYKYIDPALLQKKASNEILDSPKAPESPQSPESSKIAESSKTGEASKKIRSTEYIPRWNARAKTPEHLKELQAALDDPNKWPKDVWERMQRNKAEKSGMNIGMNNFRDIPGVTVPYSDPFCRYYPDKKLLIIENQNNISNFFNEFGKIIRTPENKAYAGNVLHGLDYHAKIENKAACYIPMPNLDEKTTKWLEEFSHQKSANSNRKMFILKNDMLQNSPRFREKLRFFILDIDQNKNA